MARRAPARSPRTDPYAWSLGLLARRDYSTAELTARLLERGFERETVAATIARLQAQEALDDRRMALAVASREALKKGHGRVRALAELERRGIPRDLARWAVAEAYRDVDEAALAERALRRRRLTRLDDARTLRRAYRYLLGQGFSPELVSAALGTRRRGRDDLP